MVLSLLVLLRASGEAVARLLSTTLSGVQGVVRLIAEAQLREAHLGGGVLLGEAALLRLDVLRLSADGAQAFEALPPRDSYPAGVPSYRIVRKRAPCAAPDSLALSDPAEVRVRPIVRRFVLRLKLRVRYGRAAKGASLRGGGGDVGSIGLDAEPTAGADAELARRCPACAARCLQVRLPAAAKSVLLPDGLPEAWIPPHVRDGSAEHSAGHILVHDVDVNLLLSFGGDASADGLPHANAPRRGPVRFEVALRGARCWVPALGQVELKACAMYARATIWCNVLERKFSLAVRDASHLTPDIEISLLGCGLPLPSCLSSALLSGCGRLVLRAFGRANPVDVDLEEVLQREGAEGAEGGAKGGEGGEETEVEAAQEERGIRVER